ncbi:hypothetical protein GO755_33300 [Spirosoma sp. HMF4905]|uniref:Uncharacterized protein n=1 Tax=Spirosoma arboris TaxID=2682092 RepID=A0A7K1SMC4_9BACT|nr:hypothetical protein [Spirosoma arboris]MVM34952.1 hypothetical protein [Spirosoma arboris]
MAHRPFPVWLDEVIRELGELDHTLVLTVKANQWLKDVWQYYQISPSEAALFFFNEYEQ